MSELAARHEVSEATLHRWREKFVAAGEAALAGNRSGELADRRRIRELETELKKRAQVIGELTMQLNKQTGESGAR